MAYKTEGCQTRWLGQTNILGLTINRKTVFNILSGSEQRLYVGIYNLSI